MESQLLFAILSISLSSIFCVSAFSPFTVYFLNCGSSTSNSTVSLKPLPSHHANIPARVFASDSQSLPFSSTSNSTVYPINQSNSLYNTTRLFNQTSSYTFPSINTTVTHVLSCVKRSTHVSPHDVIVSSAAATLVLIIAAITIIILIRKRSKPAQVPLNPKANTTTAVSRPLQHNDSINKSSSGATPKIKMELELYIPLSDIKLATNDFDEALVIGRGGFGKVYKGVLSNGTRVAVKRATDKSRQGYPEFVNEINLLSKIRHRHLVSIIGYCDEMGEMILVYELMENGTLKNYLYGSIDLPCLSWKQRLQVCIGAARGLHYLHNAHSPVIIHRDVKSVNILLGQDLLAKISDFGISKLGPLLGEDTYVSTGVKGSFGYFDPEYFTMMRLTTKSDVYSFGVVLLEILCARPVIDPRFKDEAVNLADWALHYMKKGKLEKIIDVRLSGEINPKSLDKFGEIAERCLAKYGDNRPTIGDVLWNLEYALHLQETELIREPHEDSGIVDTQIQTVSLVSRMPYASTDFDEDNNACD